MKSFTWISEFSQPLIADAGPLAAVIALATLAYAVARWWLVAGVRRLVRRSQAEWDDALVDANVFVRLAHIAPALVIYQGIDTIDRLPAEFVAVVQRVALAVMIAVVAATANSLLTALNEVYSRNPEYRHRPIKGYVQLIKLAIFGLATVAVLSTLLDRSPWLFLSGIGAMTAVLMLIFKDTILSLVASVQIASNDLLRVGDWVEMPQLGADGDVIDIALHTVKIQNWDKTITSVPTYRFIDEGFKNWRGMSRSGGRRIKRAVHLDVSSIRFLTPDEIDGFEHWELLGDYIREKRTELSEYNEKASSSGDVRAALRQLTNVGTFRAYLLNYLRSHPKIHSSGYTLMVRQLPPGPEGLPIELYCFSNDQVWVSYEGIQGDIFDHILAILPEFGLRAFQRPTGRDLHEAVRGLLAET
ncbi:MAG: mechanosensitive ion channel family protein [Myxococcota bacterium]|jgi:miniconductance mechanosensitive channel|nr:mechanosensitive ion channel family protein [Myxococcota bacterium]